MRPFLYLQSREGRSAGLIMASATELMIGFLNRTRDEIVEEYVIEVSEDAVASLGLICVTLGFFTATAMKDAIEAVRAGNSVGPLPDPEAREAYEALTAMRTAITTYPGAGEERSRR